MSEPVRSAGLLPYRFEPDLEVLIAHPGGPYYARKDAGAWSVVKGEVMPGEPDETAALREFEEETGWNISPVGWVPLGETTLKSRKVIVAWAVEAAFDPATLNPGTFTLYGRQFPEIDRVVWVTVEMARRMLNPAQEVFLERLEEQVRERERR